MLALACGGVSPTMATLSRPYGKYEILKLERSVICGGADHAVAFVTDELEAGGVVTIVWVTVAGGTETVIVTGGGVLVAIIVITFVTGGGGGGGVVGSVCVGEGLVFTSLDEGGPRVCCVVWSTTVDVSTTSTLEVMTCVIIMGASVAGTLSNGAQDTQRQKYTSAIRQQAFGAMSRVEVRAGQDVSPRLAAFKVFSFYHKHLSASRDSKQGYFKLSIGSASHAQLLTSRGG